MNAARLSLLAIVASGCFVGSSFGQLNITIEDPNKGSTSNPNVGLETATGWYKGNNGVNADIYSGTPAQAVEYMEVEPGMVGSHAWDLVAFLTNHSRQTYTLGILSGFNLATTPGNFPLGDIFISTNPSAVSAWQDGYDFGNPGNPSNGAAPGVWNYAIRPNFSTTTFDVYSLSSTTTFVNTYYVNENYNAPSNPWRIVETTATKLAAFSATSFSYVSNLSDADGTTKAGFAVTQTPYYAEFNLGNLLANDTNLLFHVTMECGNDNLMGLDAFSNTPSITPVPEPSTYGLLGALGLAGIAALRRRRGASRTKSS